MLRVFGENLRRILATQLRQPPGRAAVGPGRDQPGAVQHRHLPDRGFVRRQGAGDHRRGAGGDAGCRRRHRADGGGLLVRPVVAVAAADLRRRGDVHHAAKQHARAHRPRADRPGADHAGAAADRRRDEAVDRIARGARLAGGAAQRGVARHPGRCGAHRAVVFEPGDGAADGHAGGHRHGAGDGGAGPGDRRQRRQRRAGDARHRRRHAAGAPPAAGQPDLQAGGRGAGHSAAAPRLHAAAAMGARGAPAGGAVPPGCSTSRWRCCSSA